MREITFEYLQVKALNLLSFRPRSVNEIKFRLKRLGADMALVDKLVELLLEDGLLNDEKFARWWVEQRIKFRPKGNTALKSELMQKGVDSGTISSILLTSEQEKMIARDLVSQKGWEDRETITSRLLTRGFSSNTITAIIDELKQKE